MSAGDPLLEPFGVPDGSIGAIERFETDFVKLHHRFGGVARELDDASVRVVVGSLGAGKSLYLRMMRNVQRANGSVFAEPPSGNSADLSTDDVVTFAEASKKQSANTEDWKLLWRRAIQRSAASFLVTEARVRGSISDELLDELREFTGLLGEPKRKRRVTSEASNIIREHAIRHELQSYLHDPRWPDVETVMAEALSLAPPIFLYVDAIDDNFKWAPAHWMRCQRGLYYAIMDLMRSTDGWNRLHVVIALRDIVLASARNSEDGPRYLEHTHINTLVWTRSSIHELLQQKVMRLPDEYFERPADKSIASWLSCSEIENGRLTPTSELIGQYLIRHTRLVPRDVVVQGNRLCRYVLNCRSTDAQPSAEGIRRQVAISSREFAASQLAQCANQVISDSLPSGAMKDGYSDIFLKPNEYQVNDAVERICDVVRSVRDETFAADAVEQLNADAEQKFGQPVFLSDILWQNCLVGTLGADGRSRYFSLDDLAATTLPRAETYVFNPILFDRISELRSTLASPCFPGEE